MCVKYNRKYDPDAWYVKPSPDKCKPAWTFPKKRPIITYCSVATILKTSDLYPARLAPHVTPDRSYLRQGVCTYIFEYIYNLFVYFKISICDYIIYFFLLTDAQMVPSRSGLLLSTELLSSTMFCTMLS